MAPTTFRRRTAAGTALAALLALTACSAEEPAAAPRPSVAFTAGEVPVLEPGSPGEPVATVSPGEAGAIANPGAFGDVEVAFVQDMVPHHVQAMRMAELVPDRASDERVTSIAGRIAASQGPEIDTMQAWLSANGLPPADDQGDHTAHQGMPGMATDAQMLQLVSAEGEEFDRLFLELMTAHHEGAIAMAENASGATNPVVADMVDDVVAGQSVEIQRMQEILADL